MSVRTRVTRLERAGGGAGGCPVCGGEGLPAFMVRLGREELPEPRGCPRCGRSRLWVVHIADADDEGADDVGGGAPWEGCR